MAQIQWYPGHMAKAQREVKEKLKQVDLVLEIVDARVPISSQNPVLNEIIEQKPKLVILNKADLADPNQTKIWLGYYREHQQPAIAIDAQHKNPIKPIVKAAQEMMQEKIARLEAKGRRNVVLKAMCIGIPNVGKSTVLNRLVQKNVAVTGNKPGVTKHQQWLKTSSQLLLLDTPGILWPKFENEAIGSKLALTGAISEKVYHADDVALFGLSYFTHFYTDRLIKAYHLDEENLALGNVDLLLFLTKKWGFKDDYDQGSVRFIQDVRKGKLGRYTLDRVGEIDDQID